MTVPAGPIAAVRCEFCETVIEWESGDGQRLRFTAHDDAFCKGTMSDKIRTLRRVLDDAQRWAARRETSLRRQIAELRGDRPRARPRDLEGMGFGVPGLAPSYHQNPTGEPCAHPCGSPMCGPAGDGCTKGPRR